MSDWGFPTGYSRTGTFTVVSTTTGAANTKGAFAQIFSSTAFAAVGILVSIVPGGKSTYLLDIAVGGAGSEVVIIPNLLAQMDSSAGNNIYDDGIFIPIVIPAGVRLSARSQCTLSTNSCSVLVALVGGPLTGQGGLGRVTDYGTVLASSRGIEMTPPSSGNGAYVELTASTTNATKHLLICMSSPINNGVNYGGFVDLSVGASGSEQVVIQSIPWLTRGVTSATPIVMGSRRLIVPFSIPAGTRLAARCTGSGSPSVLKISIIVYGVD